VFKHIDDFDGYRVNERGVVQSVRAGRWRPLKLRLDEHGRPRVVLRRDGKGHEKKVHRLVIEAFGPPRPEGAICCHRDGDPANNHIDNLYWGTHAENTADMIRHGRGPRGERSHSAKIDAATVGLIRQRRTEGKTLVAIGAEFGLDVSHISRIVRGKKWRHLTTGG
jgi:hypothetical protein